MSQSEGMQSSKMSQTQALSILCVRHPPGLWGHQLTEDGTCRIVQENFIGQVGTFPTALLPSYHWPDLVT